MRTHHGRKGNKIKEKAGNEREARQNESEVHKKRMEVRKNYNSSFNKYCYLARSPFNAMLFLVFKSSHIMKSNKTTKELRLQKLDVIIYLKYSKR